MYLNYDQSAGGYQFIERYNWLPALGISLYFGVDGISAPLVLLTGVVMFTGVLISWGDDHPHVMAGIQDPSALGLGEQLFAAAIVGFALQHYYLDARIWRVSRDADVRAHLRV